MLAYLVFEVSVASCLMLFSCCSHPVCSFLCVPLTAYLLMNTNNAQATGIIEYGSAQDAERVVSHVHGKLILGRPVTAWVAVPGG